METMSTLKRWLSKKSNHEPLPGAQAFNSQVNLKRLTAYGDQMGDGALQLSFTLPVESSDQAKEAARVYAEKMGLAEVKVAHMESMGMGFSYFVVYGRAKHTIDFTKIKVKKAQFEKMDFEQVVEYAKKHTSRRIIVVGATTGSDAHTVGIDAIMNMKGYMGDYGLERYPCFRTYNLRSQVSHEELIRRAEEFKAHAILVSKVVTQRGEYLKELKELGEKIKASKKLRSKLIKIVGGPEMNHAQATKLGFDAGFGVGTLPSEVASYLVQEYVKRKK